MHAKEKITKFIFARFKDKRTVLFFSKSKNPTKGKKNIIAQGWYMNKEHIKNKLDNNIFAILNLEASP